MSSSGRNVVWLVWASLFLVIVTIAVAFTASGIKMASKLPVYGNIADFHLTNQNGQAVSLRELRGQVWVADLIFTRCPGPCLKMSRQMKALQLALPASSNARLVTLTTDPVYDTPAVFKSYAERFGADPQRWWFLTGTKKEIFGLATHSLKLTAQEKKPAERESEADLFLHSTIFVVVDKKAQLRGVFETAGDGINPIKVQRQILSAVRRLERES